MTKPATPDEQGTSTRPYLIRALHDWCTDNGFTPHIAVFVTGAVQVPMEHVRNNEIVLNVGFEATSGLKLGNETIEFKARFAGVARDIVVPVDHVVAIYAKENGQGMAFPMPNQPADAADTGAPESSRTGLRLAGRPGDEGARGVPAPGAPSDAPPEVPPPAGGGRPSLKRIK